MCCGKKQGVQFTTMRKLPNTDGYTPIRFLGSDIGTTWQAPSKKSYIVSRLDPVLFVDPVDVQWFLTKFERGKPLFAVEQITPAPAIEIASEVTEVSEVATVDDLPFSLTDSELQALDAEPAKPKRRKSSKAE
jgi:hypothetical protein